MFMSPGEFCRIEFGMATGCVADAFSEVFCSGFCSLIFTYRMLQPNPEKLDCFVRVITPENVEFEYALAGPFQRLPAFLFDVFIRVAAMFVLFIVLMFAMPFLPMGGMIASVAILLTYFLLSWFYGVYFETRWNGRTLGKMLFKLRVISVDGRPINGIQAALRNLLRLADLYPSPLVGLLTMIFTSRSQRLGDLAANTMVVVDRGRHSPWDIQPDDVRAFGLAALIPPTFVANHSLAQTVGMYMENRRRLPAARRFDVSKHLAAPLILKFELLPDTSPDLLLCALYVRIFMSEEQQQKGVTQLRESSSPRRSPALAHRPPASLPTDLPPVNVPAFDSSNVAPPAAQPPMAEPSRSSLLPNPPETTGESN